MLPEPTLSSRTLAEPDRCERSAAKLAIRDPEPTGRGACNLSLGPGSNTRDQLLTQLSSCNGRDDRGGKSWSRQDTICIQRCVDLSPAPHHHPLPFPPARNALRGKVPRSAAAWRMGGCSGWGWTTNFYVVTSERPRPPIRPCYRRATFPLNARCALVGRAIVSGKGERKKPRRSSTLTPRPRRPPRLIRVHKKQRLMPE
jgi:hypothetical protein